jgi:hypothetical protein
MVEPTTIAAIAAGASGVMGFKGNKAMARTARQTAAYNEQLAKNEAEILRRGKTREQRNLRQNSEKLASAQVTAIAKSGVTIEGSASDILAQTYFATEMDALDIEYASEIEQAAKIAEGQKARMEGDARAQAYGVQAIGSLLGGGQQAATLMG